MRNWFRVLSIWWMALAVAACASDRQSATVRAFDGVVFGTKANGPAVTRLARWQVPLRITVHGAADGEQAGQLNRVVAIIKSTTGHDIVVVPPGDGANVDLFFGDADGYLHYLRRRGTGDDPARSTGIANGYCWATTWFAGDELINAAALIATWNEAASSSNCLYHEMAHIMGLTYHPDDAYSVLDHASHAETLTQFDRALLSLLYNRRLSPGMSRAETVAMVRWLLTDPSTRF